MKRLLVVSCAMLLVFLIAGVGNASLITIGMANYLGSDYNLIYEDNSIYGGLVWLDYVKDHNAWQNQVNWASGLGGDLMVSLDPGYTTNIDWGTGWRLPILDESKLNLSGSDTGYEGPDGNGYHDYRSGYNMVNSEMGHLYYESLGGLGHVATDGTKPQPGQGLKSIDPFNNLWTGSGGYWSGSAYSPDTNYAWIFGFRYGSQGNVRKDNTGGFALAVHPGDVDIGPAPIPEPTTILLLGSGLIGLVGFRRKIRSK